MNPHFSLPGHYRFGEMCADRVSRLLDESGVSKQSVHLVGSHGQTVSGHPHWELGDLNVIAQKTGITTVGDYRPADVAVGGNGTPCTCTYDAIMLRPPPGAAWRIAINIGGTSSMTFLPPWPDAGAADDAAASVRGLDPGLGVFFMDLCVRCIDPALDFDDRGDLARSGTTHQGLLDEFLRHEYYAPNRNLPIGVGPDDFPEALFNDWRAMAHKLGVTDVDLLSTLTELTAEQLAIAADRYGGPNVRNGATTDVLLRGGVTNNIYFVERLQDRLSYHLGADVTTIKTLKDLDIDEDAWENAMYAMFGYLAFNNIYNFVPSCTGAPKPVVGGKIAPGDNFRDLRLLNL